MKQDARAAWTVLASGSDATPLTETSTGRRVEIGAVNIRDREAVEALASQAADQFGQIDILVNNAGMQHRAPLEDFEAEDFERATLELNFAE